jgi:hypothetical protein
VQESQSLQGNLFNYAAVDKTNFYIRIYMPIHLGLEHACPSKVQHIRLARRWKYENWRISRRFTCPGSTRYGHKHRSNKNKSSSSTPKISLPIPVSNLEVKKETLNRPLLSSKMPQYLKDCTWIISSSLVLWIMMLCLSRLTNIRAHKYGYHRGFNKPDHIATNIKLMPSESVISHLISPPVNWSLDRSMDSCGLRHLSCLAKVIKQGMSPIYMADPSEPSSAEVPKWKVTQLAKQREANRRHYDKKRINKVRVPGAIRTRKCRQRKNQIQSIRETPTPKDR